MRTPVSVGVVGLGTAGRRIARLLADSPRAQLRWLCEPSAKALLDARRAHAAVRATADPVSVLADESLDAVVVAAPPVERYVLARAALEADKHVLVLAPAGRTAIEAHALVAAAERAGRQLQVVHELLFHPAVRKLKELIEAGRLGELYYLAVVSEDPSARAADEGVLWALGADTVACALYLLDDEPVASLLRVETYEAVTPGEAAIYELRFATGITVWAQLSCLHPRRTLRVSAVGSRRAAVFDDVDPERKLTLYDRGAAPRRDQPARPGDILSPRLPADEPLAVACESFLVAARRPPDLGAARLCAAAVGVLESLELAADDPTPVSRAAPVLHLPLASRRASK